MALILCGCQERCSSNGSSLPHEAAVLPKLALHLPLDLGTGSSRRDEAIRVPKEQTFRIVWRGEAVICPATAKKLSGAVASRM